MKKNYKKNFKDKVNKLEQKTLQFATHLYSLGKVCHLKYKHIWAIKCYEISMKFRKRFYKDELHHDIVKNKILLGQAYLDKSKLKQVSSKRKNDRGMAKSFFDKANKDLDQIDKEGTSINRAFLYRNYGSYYEGYDNEKALKYYECDLKIKQLYYINDPEIIDCYNNIGNVYHKSKDYRKAMSCDQKCLKMLLEIYGDKYHPDIATSYHNLASCYLALIELDQAKKFAYK